MESSVEPSLTTSNSKLVKDCFSTLVTLVCICAAALKQGMTTVTTGVISVAMD
jgi:hypothetical protein